MDILKQLIGRLHPLFVHLPIGFILLGLLLQWHDRNKREYQKVISFIYKWGGITAVLACITGYLQYLGEGYAFDTVKWHLWSGIATASFSFLMFAKIAELKKIEAFRKIPISLFSIILLILISFTGHQGGNITHGSDYLIEPLPNNIKSVLGFQTFETKEIHLTEENWEEALIYEDVIMPILNNKCVSCHNPKKTKGQLLLHTKEGILEGGENGAILLANNAKQSELFHRATLPLDNDLHMPPKGKKQLTKEDLDLMEAWINRGHSFEGTIKEVGIEKSLIQSFFPVVHNYDYPDKIINTVPKDSITKIEKNGIHIDYISSTSNFLSVSCINKPSFKNEDFQALLPLKDNIARLDLGGTRITDDIINQLAQLPNLTILKLDNTSITGSSIAALSNLKHLKSINLTRTKFKEIYLDKLERFPKLKNVYLYKTGIDKTGMELLKNGQTKIDFGNYILPQIESDSIVY